MHITEKPVRKCHSCLLNLGDRCWAYQCPHEQWHDRPKCPGFENEELYAEFKEWQKNPDKPSRREQRRDHYKSHQGTEEHHNHFATGIGPLK